ncbi:MAG: PEP-CTERM sorting domain-containing protein [Phenylobacterium sp.]|uniref:PEPxxWA-CTERM sorting domain-containing protein n=1 Tax=Phenylobacterium sp. TaxID=1871053 RepID=UPI001A3DB196|nr:PEPxxWA-CTERM sorting domain-containing protein [Phenylobacterium sp.]MBL8773219.1 PEP-CTERM sorting domain-containing protein [Phenylobacterium sp.]
MKAIVAGAVAALGLSTAVSAATLNPTGYTFDAATDCGSFCYHDAGVFTGAGSPQPVTPFGELTDGVLGYAGWAVDGAAPWVGWTDSVVNIDFSFGGPFNFTRVDVGTTQDNLLDVVLPNLRVFSSNNGVDWLERWSLVTPPSDANNNPDLSTAPHVFLTLSGASFDAQYVRLEVRNQGGGYGPWSFIDEVDFTGGGVVGGVPEPSAWALMIAGFGLAGAALRRRTAAVA